jgi:hypothetical protein
MELEDLESMLAQGLCDSVEIACSLQISSMKATDAKFSKYLEFEADAIYKKENYRRALQIYRRVLTYIGKPMNLGSYVSHILYL